MPVDVGVRLADRFELIDRLAVGGMGDVYAAVDAHLDRRVAVKVLRPGVAKGEARFAAEIATLRRVEHPRVVSLLDAGEHEGLLFLVMELVPGGRALSHELADGPVRLERARRLGAQLASALAAAHAQGVVHRDVKPANILLAEAGDALLADFGIARLDDATRLTETGIAVGTASYVAPEQLEPDATVGPAADVYAVALVLLHALTGAPEFTGSVAEVAMARMTADPTVPERLPAGWRRLLSAMIARDPAARPSAATVAELLDAPDGPDPRAVRDRVAQPVTPSAAARPAATTGLGRTGPRSRTHRRIDEPRPGAVAGRRWAAVGAGAALIAGLIAAGALVDPTPQRDLEGEVSDAPEPAGTDGSGGDVADASRGTEDVPAP